MKDATELDLSICQRVAEKLGGQLIYDENYRQGTRFMLVLPQR
jgi:signal transduction histidine kinase